MLAHSLTSSKVQCRACRTSFDEGAWAALTLSRRIDAAEIGRFLRGWPSGDCIEVRICRVCGTFVTLRRPAPRP
jgi:hypothetical protein